MVRVRVMFRVIVRVIVRVMVRVMVMVGVMVRVVEFTGRDGMITKHSIFLKTIIEITAIPRNSA